MHSAVDFVLLSRGLSSELDLLHQYRDTSNFDNSNLSIDTLRDLSLPELAEKAGEKYRSGFELGRPFFGFGQGQQGKEQGTTSILAARCI